MFWIIRDIGICWFFDGLSHQGRSTINGSVFQEQYRLIVLGTVWKLKIQV